ncbi:DUF4124 domain-containing protein [Lysobacter sp. F6437]|uniref:DUF4124 domain-containing protein n=1 Tax=Lysobacter sp. F6437 TaxID=3459296 RepID=UPI00403DA865
MPTTKPASASRYGRSRDAIARAWAWLPIIALALGTVAPAGAQDSVVIYRCTDASGAVTVQNDVRCPKGSRQERRVIETAAAAPYTPPVEPAVPPPEPAAPVEPTPASAVIEAPPPDAPSDPSVPLAERTPPPPLFACKTWNREEYFSDSTTPAQRCAPMQTTGLGGDPAQGAGAACMVVSDFCQPVPEAALCESWRDHLIRSEAIVEFDRAQDPDAAAAELERVRTIVAHSTCD